MKLLLIADTTYIRCGWGRYTFNILKEFRARNIDYVVFTNSLSPEKSQVPISHEYQSLLPPKNIKNLIANVLLIRKHLTSDVDAVHAFDCWPFAVYALLSSFGKKINTFISGVGTYSVPPEQISFKRFVMKLAYMRSKMTFSISSYTERKILTSVPKAKIKTVHWGTSTLPELTPDRIEKFIDIFNIPRKRFPIILTVGQIKHRKGQIDTLEAVSLLKEKYPSILYVVVGDDGDVQYVEKMKQTAKKLNISDNLKIITNQKTDKELAFFYSICDIFAMNSNNESDHFEGFGLVFLEAAQFGKPAIGSAGCGIEDAIADGQTGFLCRQGDEEDIAKKIDTLLSGNLEKFGANARLRGKEFTWQKTVKSYLAAYEANED